MDLKKYSEKSQLLQEAYDLLHGDSKPLISKVTALYERVKALNFHQEDGFTTIDNLNSMIAEYERWFSETMGHFKKNTPDEETVRKHI